MGAAWVLMVGFWNGDPSRLVPLPAGLKGSGSDPVPPGRRGSVGGALGGEPCRKTPLVRRGTDLSLSRQGRSARRRVPGVLVPYPH